MSPRLARKTSAAGSGSRQSQRSFANGSPSKTGSRTVFAAALARQHEVAVCDDAPSAARKREYRHLLLPLREARHADLEPRQHPRDVFAGGLEVGLRERQRLGVQACRLLQPVADGRHSRVAVWPALVRPDRPRILSVRITHSPSPFRFSICASPRHHLSCFDFSCSFKRLPTWRRVSRPPATARRRARAPRRRRRCAGSTRGRRSSRRCRRSTRASPRAA